MSVDLGGLARQTAGRLAADHVWVVVAAVVGSSAEISAAGTTGVADRAPGADSIFEIGSITKVFTALALAKQSLAGLVDLDEPVRQLLPAGVQVPSRAGREITLRHLATHTSGLPRLPKGMLWRATAAPQGTRPVRAMQRRAHFRGAVPDETARTTRRPVPLLQPRRRTARARPRQPGRDHLRVAH